MCAQHNKRQGARAIVCLTHACGGVVVGGWVVVVVWRSLLACCLPATCWLLAVSSVFCLLPSAGCSPQVCMRQDRLSAKQQWSMTPTGALDNEFSKGLVSLVEVSKRGTAHHTAAGLQMLHLVVHA